MSNYAIISVGGKQYRVHEGERLLVNRLPHGEGKTFNPPVLLTGGGDKGPDLQPSITVTARVVADVKGEKIRIGKYRPKNGYKKHNGFRASLSQIEIESIGGTGKRAAPAKSETAKPETAKVQSEPTEAPKQAAAAAPAPAAAEVEVEHVKGMPAGYEDLTVAAIKTASAEWNRPMLEAALAYEQANAARKGALAAIESALAAKEEENS